MSAPKTADQWFAEYGESHRNPVNELIHWICVPVIFFCVLGLLWSIPVPAPLAGLWPGFKWSWLAVMLALIFYVRLSTSLAVGLLIFILVCYGGLHWLAVHSPWPVWQACLALFVLAWIGQFIGHQIEGRKPSFFHDVVFLLIGPAWLLHFVYKRLGIKY
jgi:uncharacterized membrane protein YGL010W